MKKCSKCKKIKSMDNFRIDNNAPDGLRYWCNDCLSIYHKNYLKENPIKNKQYKKKYNLNHPWMLYYRTAKERCTNPKNASYNYYGLKGIKFLLTLEEVKFLYKRDKAHLMKKASIDRKNSKGNYELSNCRFMEKEENQNRRWKNVKF